MKEDDHRFSNSRSELESLRAIVARYKAANLIPDLQSEKQAADASLATETDVLSSDHLDTTLKDLYILAGKLIAIREGSTEGQFPNEASQKDVQEMYEKALEIAGELAEEKEEIERRITRELERIENFMSKQFGGVRRETISSRDFSGLSVAITRMYETYEGAYSSLQHDFECLQDAAAASKGALLQLKRYLKSLHKGQPCEVPCEVASFHSLFTSLNSAAKTAEEYRKLSSELQTRVEQLTEDIDIKRLLLLHIKEESERISAENKQLRGENAKLKQQRSQDELLQQLDESERTIESLRETIGALHQDLKAKDKIIEINERRLSQLEDSMKEAETKFSGPSDFNARMNSLQSQLQEYYSAYDSPDSSEGD